MNREADYSIKGFLYQFNLTLCKILEENDDSEIMVEGIVEDIDVISDDKITAIQCKYHETKDKYKLSYIYKPVLQMMVNFLNEPNNNIDYILYAYFSDESHREHTITDKDIHEIIKSQNKDYVCKYISKIKPPQDKEIIEITEKSKVTEQEKKKVLEYYKKNIDKLDFKINIYEFISKFRIIFGRSFDELCQETKDKMSDIDMSKEDIEDLFYPNAIQKIADLSINHDSELRKIKKSELIKGLKNNKKTAISRWTRELKSYNNLMKKRKEQIKYKLNSNGRRIHFIINSEMIENFDDEIVNFITEYNNKYNFKVKLHETPLFCIDKACLGIENIENRLYRKNVLLENGIRGDQFFKEAFLRQPQKKILENWREFDIRICEYNESSIEAMNNLKADILFVINKEMYENIDLRDIDIEILYIKSFKELKYLLSITNVLD